MYKLIVEEYNEEDEGGYLRKVNRKEIFSQEFRYLDVSRLATTLNETKPA